MDPARAALRVDARLELEFERRGGRTVLARSYVEPPFHIGRSFDIDDAAYVIVACTGPGVFAGDTLSQTVRIGPGARVVIASQSALQAHPAATHEPAAIDCRYILGEDAELHAHWDPLIPFADAAVAQRFAIRMPSSARLAWSEAVMAGRVTRGEVWRFRALSHELRLDLDGAPEYLERYDIQPARQDVSARWTAGDATYFGTALLHHPDLTDEHVETVHRALGAIDGVHAAVDRITPSLATARIAACRGVGFAAARALCRRMALESLFKSPALAGRRSV
jgi:urease accessory protein UreH